jgi:hypothetical protein
MVDMTAGGDLPNPAQMRTFYEVSRAVGQARRMREASRAVITGNVAFVFCLIGTFLEVAQARWAGDASPFVMCGLMFGYFVGLALSLRWMKRQRARSLVTVVDRREEAARTTVARPWRLIGYFVAMFVFQAACALGWGVAFRHMSNAAIVASLLLLPIMGISYFVGRFVIYRFWEDLLFTGCVALAFAPMFLQARGLTPLSLLSLLLVILGAASLHSRWVIWSRSLAGMDSEDISEEVRS